MAENIIVGDTLAWVDEIRPPRTSRHPSDQAEASGSNVFQFVALPHSNVSSLMHVTCQSLRKTSLRSSWSCKIRP